MFARRLSGAALIASLGLTVNFLSAPALALDGSTTPTDQKIVPGRTYKSAREALRVGVDDLHAGDAASSAARAVEARLHLRRRRSRAAQ
jgi:hypothetical protein